MVSKYAERVQYFRYYLGLSLEIDQELGFKKWVSLDTSSAPVDPLVQTLVSKFAEPIYVRAPTNRTCGTKVLTGPKAKKSLEPFSRTFGYQEEEQFQLQAQL